MKPDDDNLAAKLRWLLVGLTMVVYWRVSQYGFINYDDPVFVMQNPHVYTGLGLANLKWAFATLNGDATSYQPLTWLTHQLDCHLFGLQAGVHHLTNLWLHAANTVLLFTVLDKLTSKPWRSAVVAALFALHPLHVETVAWISERKSLVCTLFWLLATLAYIRYARRAGARQRTPHTPSVCPASPTGFKGNPDLRFRRSPRGSPGSVLWSYSLVLLLFAAALVSKPIAVSLPLTLLLLDLWPLNRCAAWMERQPGEPALALSAIARLAAAFRPLVIEKLPLFLLSGVACWVTVTAQEDLGATKSLEEVPLGVRLSNSVLACVIYLRRLAWPMDLAPIYPLRHDWPWWQVACGGLLLLGISLWTVSRMRERPYRLVGWYWYLATLFPTLGLVQVGAQGMADRYSYVPLVGPFLWLVWEASERIQRPRLARPCLAIAALGACALCTAVTVQFWQSSLLLFQHAVRVTKDNYIAYRQLGLAWQNEGNLTEAVGNFRESLRINPRQASGHAYLAVALSEQGRCREALEHYSAAIQLKPADASLHRKLAELLMHTGEPDVLDPHRAVAEARLACELTRYRRRGPLVTLARAYMENRQVQRSLCAARHALALSVGPQEVKGATDLVAEIGQSVANGQRVPKPAAAAP